MSLVKKFATVASGTLMSRVLGFAREMLMAAALGTGPIADAFNAAFQFPNTFRRLFAEGAFNAAFVPLFAKEIEANGIDGAKRFSEEVFGVLFTVLLALTIAHGTGDAAARARPSWRRALPTIRRNSS